MFGLGDTSYDTYSQGSEHIDNTLTELGAHRVGVYGRHDASDGSLPNEDALKWVQHLYEHFHYPYPAMDTGPESGLSPWRITQLSRPRQWDAPSRTTDPPERH